MTFYEFLLSTVTSSVVVGAALVAARDLIATRLTASVKHEFDMKLEAGRAEFKAREQELQHTFNMKLESVRSALKDRESEIQLLRTNLLTGVAGRQAAIEQRRLAAIEQLWDGWYGFSKHQMAVQFIAYLKIDLIQQQIPTNPKLREFIAQLDQFDLTPLAEKGWQARPFVSPLAWAIYLTYTTIIAVSVFKFKQLQIGGVSMLDEDAVVELVVAAFPEKADYIRRRGTAAFAELLKELDTKFFAEIANMLSGNESDAEMLRQSQRILEAAGKANSGGAGMHFGGGAI